MERYSAHLPKFAKFIVKLLLTPPGINYLIVTIFFILVLASIVGWPALAEVISIIKSLWSVVI